MASRRKAFRSPSEEYAKILEIVGRYAIHCTGVAFSCKKHGESAMSISTPSNASTADSIRQIHGSAVANELIDFQVSDEKWGFKAAGWTSNANYHVKKTSLLLFINHRSVESSAIKKAIEQTYSTYLPRGGHPFTYLSLDIDPQRVDVNVHPTKREVNFLNEEEIIECICAEIATKLTQVDTSRTFRTQSLLPNAKTPVPGLSKTRADTPGSSQRQPSATPVKPWEYQLVRTDPQLRKITSMLPPSTNSASTPAPPPTTYHTSSREPIEYNYRTIKHLRASVRDSMHAGLTAVFASHTYVGLVDSNRRIAAIQGGVKLYLVDYGMVSNDYFYQLGLTDFGNFGAIKFETPLDIRSLISIGVKHEKALGNPGDENVPWDTVPDMVTKQLVASREMLTQYFTFEVSAQGELLSLPLLTKGYTPSLAKLPRFLMRLGPCVNWVDEEACFHTFLKELASFYTPEQLPATATAPSSTAGGLAGDDADARMEGGEAAEGDELRAELEGRREEMSRVLEHVLFPAFRARLVATKGLLGGVVEVANLKGLYRVFERC